MVAFIRFADSLSAAFGKAFAWLIILMTFGTSYEVFVRYVLNDPTPWAFDVSFIMYGTLFMMGGAYTLSRGGHVRGDFLYRLWKPKTQATVDLVLYLIFFFPGVTALIVTGWKYAARSVGYGEAVMVAAGILLFIQGIAEIFRCIQCIRTGYWMRAHEDVQETEDAILNKATAAESDAHP